MKRVEKKNVPPEKSAAKTKKPAAAKTAEQKKTADKKEKPVVAAKTPVKKLKPETSPKNLQGKENPLNSKKTKPVAAESRAKKLKAETPVKVSKEKALTSKQTIKIIAEKPAPKTNAAVSVKIPVTPPKAKKTAAGKAVEPEKSAPLKKKTAAAQAKTAGKSKLVNPAKISVSKPEVRKPAGNSVSKQRKEKTVQPVLEKPAKTKKEPVLPKAEDKKVKPKRKKVEIVVPAINGKQNKKAAEHKAVTVLPAANRGSNIKALTAQKKTARKGGKKVEKKIEIVIPPIAAKPVRKKIKPIGSAVVRGKTRRYDFEVFPLDAELKDGSAIYVISKRITDKRGRGHHKFVCIGQTESFLGEIKKHKKDKCIKQHKANVICLLREESETNRLKIETDLREAHTIVCNQK